MNPVKRFCCAASFVTCIPLYRLPPDSQSGQMPGLSGYLPSVGLLIGLLLAAAAACLKLLHTDPIVIGAALTVAWLGLTGGMHFDGLMDTADGIFSHRDTKRMLEIMQDSRVGNFGAMTGMSVMLVKIAALSSLPLPALYQAVLVVPVWARFCETIVIGCFAYLREAGMGKVWHDTTRAPRDLLLAGLLPASALGAALFCGYAYPLFLAAATVVAGLAAGAWLNAVLKGHTGDTYGCVVEIAEAGGLLIAALATALPGVGSLVLPA